MGKQKDIHATSAYKKRRMARFLRRFRRRSWWMVLVLIVVVQILVQVFYPKDYTLPLAEYNNEPYGFKKRDDMVIMEQAKFVATKLELNSSSGSDKVDLVKLGGKLDESANFNYLSEYPNNWRWVPFSILFWQPNVTKMAVSFDEKPLTEYTLAYAKKYSKKATDAGIVIEDGKVDVKEGKQGNLIDATKLSRSIKDSNIDISSIVRINVPEKTVNPTVNSSNFAKVRQQAEDAISKQIVVSFKGRSAEFKPSREQIASWLKVIDEGGGVKLVIDSESFGAYMNDVNKSVAKPAGRTVVNVVDDNEVSRQEGAPGEQINRGDFEQKISSILFVPGSYKYISIDMEPVKPEVQTNYSFSYTQAGLQAKLNQIGRRYNVRVSLHQLNGNGWRASYRGSESTPSASTYKLYVAIRLFEEIKAGRISWQSPILGTNVEGCFHQMIIVSTNQCAEEWIRQFGRSELNDYLYKKSISQSTTFTADGATRTSADDLLRVVIGINDGSLATGYERDKLLEMMSRQIWRQGIPAGTKGWAADKVGFLWDYVHDTGIVHHPKGAYAVAIMTKGANYGIIAQITRELEAQMYP